MSLTKINIDSEVTTYEVVTKKRPKSIMDKVSELAFGFGNEHLPTAIGHRIITNGFKHPKKIEYAFNDGSMRILTIHWERTILKMVKGQIQTTFMGNHGNNAGTHTTGNITGYKLLPEVGIY